VDIEGKQWELWRKLQRLGFGALTGTLIAACSANQGSSEGSTDDAVSDDSTSDDSQETETDTDDGDTGTTDTTASNPTDDVPSTLMPGTAPATSSVPQNTVPSENTVPSGDPTVDVMPSESSAAAPTNTAVEPETGGEGGSGGLAGDEPPQDNTAGASTDVGPDTSAPSQTEAPTHEPDIPVVFVGEGPNAGLTVTHSRLTLDESGLLEWFAVIDGEGPDPVCGVGLNAELRDAAGNVLTTLLTTAKAPIYESFGGPNMCIGAGDQGVSYGVDFGGSFLPSDVAEIAYGIAGNINPDAVPRDWVSVSEIDILEDGGSYQFSGTISDAEETLNYPEVTIYPMNAAGMPLGEVSDINPDDIAAGGSWTFTTTYYDGEPFTEFYVFVEYDTGF
jgi:hypothetical protein